MAPDTPLALRCTDVEVSYRVRTRRATFRDLARGTHVPHRIVEAVRGIDLVVTVAQSVGIVGSNGSGKSTLLRAIAGLLPVASGSIRVRSQPALLGVNAVLRNTMSGRRNIEIGLLAQGLRWDEMKDVSESVVEFTGLDEFIDLPMSTYSSGMRARLHFAIATEISPEILLIDEALAVGDRRFREKSAKRLDKHRDNAGTILLVSHQLSEIRRTCDRAVWIEDGLIRADGPTEETLEKYEAS